jgi:type VI secretion system FHA domain protein
MRYTVGGTMPTLTLEIARSPEANPRDASRHVFGEEGGSIGRAATSSWVLTHNKVSGQHAQISFRNGVFYIQDNSRNGVSVNSPENRLVRSRPYALNTGDRIFIEPYEIDVWIDAGSPRQVRQPSADPFAESDPFAPHHDALLPDQHLGPLAGSPVNEEVDPLKFFDPVGGRAPRKPDPIVPNVDDILGQHYQPPAVLPGPAPSPQPAPFEPMSIPAGYDPLSPDEPVVQPMPPPPPPSPPPTPPIRPRPGDSSEIRRRAKDSSSTDSTIRRRNAAAASSESPARAAEAPIAPIVPPPRTAEPAPRHASHTADLAELLAGAGVSDAVVTPELSRNLGQILRIVVSGLMDILQSRQRIKEEFGIQHTMFRPADNNPLKFSANVEDALHNLLVKRNAAYLGPVDAFADAFDDLRDHQLAMLAGLRVAFDAMLAEFDADKLQQEFDDQMGKHALPLMPAKMRYWELLRERQQDMAKDADATFDRLFGDEFKRAYEEQFRKLKAARRPRAQQSPDTRPPDK